MPPGIRPLACCIVFLALAPLALASEEVVPPRVRYVETDAAMHTSRAVVVTDAALAHTGQLLPLDAEGNLAGQDLAAQFGAVWQRLQVILQAAGSDVTQLVKVHLYIAEPDDVSETASQLALRLPKGVFPALATVITPLPHSGARVAIDAVAMADDVDQVVYSRGDDSKGTADVAVLPSGAALYVAGQAEPGSLAEATAKTLASLKATVEHAGGQAAGIVQLKAFVTPMSDAEVVRREVARFFGEGPQPPLVLVEWESSLPIEIELIAALPQAALAAAPRSPVEYFTPPGMTSSPVFSRAALVHSGQRIYIGDLIAERTDHPSGQVREVFDTLQRLLRAAGSDLRHLVKATYYVTDGEVSRQLNELRPEYYDPARPPAASKAVVAGISRADRTLAVDMLAVPKPAASE